MDPIRKPISRKEADQLELNLVAVEKQISLKKVSNRIILTLFGKAVESVNNGNRLFPGILAAIKSAIKSMGRVTTTPSGSTVPTNEIGTHEYVELGDGLKWATCNLGATKPEESGDYFSWGEIEPFHTSLDPLVFKEGRYSYGYEYNKYFVYDHCNSYNYTVLKYNETDGKVILDPADDAASVNWGGKWRTPTKEELERLCDKNNFTWTSEEKNGVKGVTVTSKIKGYEGNKIFLPAVAYLVGRTNLAKVLKNRCYYWSSSKDLEANGEFSRALYIHTDNAQPYVTDWGCFYGTPIRPVSE